MDADKAAKILADAIQNPAKYGASVCALCSSKEITTGAIFNPPEEFAEKFGQPKGKKRILVYALCPRCSKLPDAPDKVEAKMLEHYGRTN